MPSILTSFLKVMWCHNQWVHRMLYGSAQDLVSPSVSHVVYNLKLLAIQISANGSIVHVVNSKIYQREWQQQLTNQCLQSILQTLHLTFQTAPFVDWYMKKIPWTLTVFSTDSYFYSPRQSLSGCLTSMSPTQYLIIVAIYLPMDKHFVCIYVKSTHILVGWKWTITPPSSTTQWYVDLLIFNLTWW